MNNKGITLIELVVVVTIIGILAVALGFEFSGWMGRYKVESQAKNIYMDMMNTRARAMQRNRAHFVVVTTSNYQVFEDTNENNIYNSGTDQPIQGFASAKALQYKPVSGATVTIDMRGLVSPDPTTIRFNYDFGGDKSDYDCILLETTRINMGQWDGANCVAR